MFLHALRAPHRCVVPSLLPSLFADVDGALAGTSDFVADMMDSEAQLFGSEGMNAGYQRAWLCMGVCFEWSVLVHTVPTPQHLEAFRTLYGLLLPYLRHTLWPSRDLYPRLTHGWPDAQSMLKQYVLLLNRVRSAPARAPEVTRRWWTLIGCRVSEVRCPDRLLMLLQQKFQAPEFVEIIAASSAGRLRNVCAHVGSVVAAFLGGFPRTRSFQVSPQMLVRCGFPWQGRVRASRLRRTVARAWRLSRSKRPPTLATLVLPGCVGRLVRIEEALRELSWSAVSAALDMHPFFAFGNGKQACAWHALRLHHHCRCFGSPEAICERIGSVMKQHWTNNPSVNPSVLMESTLLSSAGVACLGDHRDEALVADVADTMLAMGRSPILQARAKRQRLQQGLDTSRALRNLRADHARVLADNGRISPIDSSESEPADDSDESHLELAAEQVDMDAKRFRGGSSSSAADPATVRELAGMVAKARAKAKPAMRLPTAAEAALKAAVVGGQVAALPVTAQQSRQGRGPQVASSSGVRARMTSWLDSDLGRQWKEARDRRLQGD